MELSLTFQALLVTSLNWEKCLAKNQGDASNLFVGLHALLSIMKKIKVRAHDAVQQTYYEVIDSFTKYIFIRITL